MGMSLYNMDVGALGMKAVGELWTPKAQRIRVGSEVMPLSHTAVGGRGPRNVVVAEGDDVRLKSAEYFAYARSAAISGQPVQNFRQMDDAAVSAGFKMDVDIAGGGLKPLVSVLYADDKQQVTYAGGKIQIREQGGEEKVLEEVSVSGDMRIAFDQDGNAVIHSGPGALTDGKLTALGDNEILIRASGVDVRAGAGATVFNLSNKGGAFSGGTNVTYLGAYRDSSFEGAAGTTTYAGYFAGATILAGSEAGTSVFEGVFEGSEITGGNADDRFTGYFSASQISGKNGADLFSGMFLNGSTVTGDDGDDGFNGRFVDSTLDGGAGDNTFGNGSDLDKVELFTDAAGRSYGGLAADFVDTVVKAGDGDDSFDGIAYGGSISMGAGSDTAAGVFTAALVRGQEGDDALSAKYSRDSSFETGEGEDSVILGTALSSVVRTGEGTNTVRLGHNLDGPIQGNGHAADGDLKHTGWLTPDEARNNVRPREFGELDGNQVLAEEGDNAIHVHNGQGTNSVITGSMDKAPRDAPAEEEDAAQTAETLDTAALSIPPAPPAQEGLEASETRRRRAAVDRYVLQFGDAPLTEGPIAAVIDTGAGEISLNGLRREAREPGPVGMQRYTRRGNGFGAYDTIRFKL